MNRDIAERWAQELESGKWLQGDGNLRRLRSLDDTVSLHCCLGVLCEMAVEAGVIPPPTQVKALNTGTYTYMEHMIGVPPDVRNWAGVRTSSGVFDDTSLTVLNDDGTPFSEIAQVIRQYAEEL